MYLIYLLLNLHSRYGNLLHRASLPYNLLTTVNALSTARYKVRNETEQIYWPSSLKWWINSQFIEATNLSGSAQRARLASVNKNINVATSLIQSHPTINQVKPPNYQRCDSTASCRSDETLLTQWPSHNTAGSIATHFFTLLYEHVQ